MANRVMAIPGPFDRKLGEISDAAFNITNTLAIMERANAADLPRMRAGLRDRLREFVDLAMKAARDE